MPQRKYTKALGKALRRGELFNRVFSEGGEKGGQGSEEGERKKKRGKGYSDEKEEEKIILECAWKASMKKTICGRGGVRGCREGNFEGRRRRNGRVLGRVAAGGNNRKRGSPSDFM